MPGLSKVIVLDPDARAGQQVRLGFEREGVPTTLAELPAAPGAVALPADGAGLVIVGGTDDAALALLRRAREALDARQLAVPIVFTGRGVHRAEAEAAGADEVVLRPAYLRDVVTIGRLLRGVAPAQRDKLVGNLAETTGVYTLVRALAALGRSAVLTLMRGLRRGEIRFFHGEVTSAQVGLIHGQAAFHQLLLWTDARFEFQHEDIVRRQQIPLSHAELFADAERFLEGVRDSSGGLSPSMILEQDLARIQSLGKQVPTEVQGVLRMFDGHRVLADVLEDSPYRVFETLRVAQRAVDVGLLRPMDAQRPKATWRAVLAIEEWLVGSDREAVLERTQSASESGAIPAARDTGGKSKGSAKRRRKKRRANTPVAGTAVGAARPDIDWGALVPRTVGAEVGSLSGVIPAMHTSGEIEMPTREAPRERLEAMMDTGLRERIFATDIGLPEASPPAGSPEAKVVLDDARRPAVAAAGAAPAAAPATATATAPAAVAAAAPAAVEETAAVTAPAAVKETAAVEETAANLVKDLVSAEGRGPVGAPSPTVTEAPPITVSETATATVTVQDTLTIAGSAGTAVVTATPTATVTEAPRPADAAPKPATDDPSDGVVRTAPVVETAPVVRRPPPGEPPSDDRPDPAKGEISTGRARRETIDPAVSEPSILIADLAAAQSAVSAIAAAQATAPASPDIASPSRELVVADVRKDAELAFSEAEEEFFRAGVEKTTRAPVLASESFEDLDEGYQPVGFWDRLLGKKPTKKPTKKPIK